jgi:hypothetical protein
MSRLAGVAIGLGLLAIALALALPTLLAEGEGSETGRYALLQAAPGVVYRIDTATGDAWVSEHGGDWRVIEEPEEAPDELRPSSTDSRPSQHTRHISLARRVSQAVPPGER